MYSSADGSQSILPAPRERRRHQRQTPAVQISSRVSTRSCRAAEGLVVKARPRGRSPKPVVLSGTAPRTSFCQSLKTEKALTSPVTVRLWPLTPRPPPQTCCTTTPPMWHQNTSNRTTNTSSDRPGCLTFDPARRYLPVMSATLRFVPRCFRNTFYQAPASRQRPTSVLTAGLTLQASGPSQMPAPSRVLTPRGVPSHRVTARSDWQGAEGKRWLQVRRFLWQHTLMWTTVWRKHTASSTTTRGPWSSLPQRHGPRAATCSPVTHTHKTCQTPDLKQVRLCRE